MKKLLYLLPLLVIGSAQAQLSIAVAASQKADQALTLANNAYAVAGQARANLANANMVDLTALSGMSAGDILIYDGSDIVAEPINQLTSATGFESISISGLNLRVNGSPPGLAGVLDSGALEGYHFDDTSDEQAFFSIQFPHNWREGSVIHPHVHWMAESTNIGNITWGLEYSWQNINGEFSTPTTIIGNDASEGAAWQHLICGLTSITNESATFSSVLIGRLFRDANASEVGSTDDLAEDITLLSVDIHIEVDGIGSSEEYVK